MSDFKAQRNVAIGVAVLVVTFAAGYLLSDQRSGNGSAPDAPPAVGASAPADAAVRPADAVSPAAGTVEPVDPPAPPLAVGERRANSLARSGPSSTSGRDSSESSAAASPAIPVEPHPEQATGTAPAAPPAPRVERVTIPSSTSIVLDLQRAVSSQTAQPGDEVVAELAEPIRVAGSTVVPAGTRVVGRVTETHALRKVGGKAILGISFDRLESSHGGAAIAASFRREGKSETGKDTATIAAGAAIGTILGNQAKSNDRGKLLGAIVGAAAGTAVAAKTPGEIVELPAGARLQLTLREDVDVTIDLD